MHYGTASDVTNKWRYNDSCMIISVNASRNELAYNQIILNKNSFYCCFTMVFIKLFSIFKEIFEWTAKNLDLIAHGGVYTHSTYDIIILDNGHHDSSCLSMSKILYRLIVDCLVFDVLMKGLDGMEWNGMTWHWINLYKINSLPSL